MHMADALLSPAVGGAMWVATGATVAYSARHVRRDLDESKIPLMGVAGAFVFAAQMLNFSIPGTGSSGHIGGALLLAILLGPEAAFLVMASVLTVQALFFADGGLLALGANIFNLGFFPAFVAYPLVYRKIVGAAAEPSRRRVIAASVTGAVVGLQFGALAVVLETTASGITALPFAAFLALMQPIHLAIGIVEGLATAVVVLFVMRAQPDLLAGSGQRRPFAGRRLTPVLAGLAVAAVVAGAALSWFASPNVDGLEWSIARVIGANEELSTSSSTHQVAEETQARLAILPDYAFKPEDAQEAAAPSQSDDEGAWPAVSAGTSLSGLAGAAITLLAAGVLGLVLRRRSLARSRAGDRT